MAKILGLYKYFRFQVAGVRLKIEGSILNTETPGPDLAFGVSGKGHFFHLY
jgi:hypothetical protein